MHFKWWLCVTVRNISLPWDVSTLVATKTLTKCWCKHKHKITRNETSDPKSTDCSWFPPNEEKVRKKSSAAYLSRPETTIQRQYVYQKHQRCQITIKLHWMSRLSESVDLQFWLYGLILFYFIVGNSTRQFVFQLIKNSKFDTSLFWWTASDVSRNKIMNRLRHTRATTETYNHFYRMTNDQFE